MVRLANNSVGRVNVIKYLGVYIDETLNFFKHIEYINAKSRNIFQSLRRYNYRNWTNLANYQVTLKFISILAYSIEIWGID